MPVIGIEKLEPKSPVKSENHSKQSTMESGEESSTSEVFTRSPSKKKTFIKDARKPSTNKENKMDEDDWSDEDDNTKKVAGKSSKGKPKELEFKSVTQLEESIKLSDLMIDFPEEMFEEVSEM